MPHAEPSLDDLRREIDRIDDALLDLIAARGEVTKRIRALKRTVGGSVLRPGREAQVLRRLTARAAGLGLEPALVVGIWREIIAAHTRLQTPLVVVTCRAGGPEPTELARAQFGAATPLLAVESAAEALAALDAGRAGVAVLPSPTPDGPGAWWIDLAEAAAGPRVIARLPVLGERAGAWVLAAADAVEPSGDDITPLAIDASWGLVGAQLNAVLATAGLEPAGEPLVAAADDWSLAEVAGCIGAEDLRLEAARAGLGRVVPLGCYAKPIPDA